jgi:lambda family phage portal protein
MLKNGVVGPEGFQLQCMFKNPNGELDEAANKAFEAHWHKWASNPAMCDVRGQFNFAQICSQIVGALPQDGEFILRRWFNGEMGLQYQIVEPMLLDVMFQEDLRNGNMIRCGIEFDPFLKPLAYWFNEKTDFYYNTGKRFRVSANEIIHGFMPIGIDQMRGLPWLSGPMQRLHMLGGYEEAAIINARYGASKMGFIKRGDGSVYTGPTDSTGRPIEELAPGTIEELGPHDDFQGFDPSYPAGEFKDFVRQQLRGVASGLNMSYPTLANDLEGVNYNSLRHDAIETRDVFRGLQEWFKGVVLQRVYSDWLDTQLARGIPIPRKRGGGSRAANATLRQTKYNEVRWQGRRWQWVDPAKEMAANRDALELRLTSRARLIREQGNDPEEIWRELQDEEARFGPIEPKGANNGGSADDTEPDATEAGDDQQPGDKSGSANG